MQEEIEQEKPKRKPIKKWVWLTLIIVIIAMAAVLLYVALSSGDKSSTKVDKNYLKGDVDAILLRTNHVIVDINEGRADDAIKMYDERFISATSDPKIKSDMYREIAGLLHSQRDQYGNKYDSKILEYAYKAETLNPTVATAMDIARYEADFGDAKKAKEYEELGMERMKDSNVDTPEDRQ